jgi:hypothetical protein
MMWVLHTHLILSSDTSLPHGPGAAVGFGRGVGLGVGLGVGEGVAVGVAVAVGVSESVVVVSDVATTFATGVSVDAPVACDGCNVAVGVSKPRATDLSIREARNRP